MTEHTESPEEPDSGDGSMADDLGKLWAAVLGMVGDLSATASTVAPACNGLAWCPVCRTGNLVAHCSPEVVEHLAAATRSLLLALSSALKPDAPEKPGFERITLVEEADQSRQSD